MMSIKFAGVAFGVVIAAALQGAPTQAASLFVSQSGIDNSTCSFATPCATIAAAISAANGDLSTIACLDDGDYVTSTTITQPIVIDCTGTTATFGPFTINVSSGGAVVVRGGAINDPGPRIPMSAIVLQNGALVLEQTHLTNTATSAITATSASPVSLVVRNVTIDNVSGGAAINLTPTGGASLTATFDHVAISNSSSGVLIQPGSGASVTAKFDHLTVTNNTGGGFHADSSNGPVTVDITDSTISDNSSNGFNVTSGTGGQNNVMNISGTTIAKNGLVGIQVGGGNAAVLVDTTLLDSNASGATLAGNNGRILSYGNNRIVGSPGSGFTDTAPLQ